MNRIKEYRIKARMTQSDLSAYLEIPTRTIEDWETEKRNPAPWAEELIIRQLEELIHPCLMKKLLNKFSDLAYISTVSIRKCRWRMWPGQLRI